LSSANPPNFKKRMPSRQPLLWAALAFACGLWAGKYLWRPPSWWVIAALMCTASAAYLLKRRVIAPRGLVLAAVFVAGVLTIQVRSSGDTGQVWLGDGEQVFVTAHVIAEGNLQADGPAELHQRIDVETERIESGQAFPTQSRSVHAGIRLNIYSRMEEDDSSQAPPASAMQLFRYGQRIKFPATLVTPRNYRNPGAFDYATYLRDKGIIATASTKYAAIQLLPGFSGSRAMLGLARVHRSVIEKVHALWPEHVAGLMDAIVIGEESFIDRPERVDFQRSGTYHVLVVSGMNVSILAMFTLWTLRRTGLNQVAASACAIVLILAYALLTNIGPPVWRAALMFAVYLTTRLLYRNRAMLNALGAAALALLLVDPEALFGASFQMTFLCVGLVAGVGIPLLERTIEPYRQGLRNLDALAYDRSLPPRVAQFRLDLRLLLNRIGALLPGRVPRWILLAGLRGFFGFAELIVISAVLQIGLALPMAYYFHRATSIAMPANLLVVPFLQLLMPAAVLAIEVSYVSLSLAKIPAAVAGFALEGIAGTVKWLGGLRLADVRVATPDLAAIVFAGLAIFVCAALMRRRAWISIAGLGMLAASAVWIWTIPPPQQIRQGVLEMTAIDVGQGDSIFLVMPDGRMLMVDAGGLPFWMHSQLDIGEDVVSPYLWSRGIARLDAIALTHAHADHMGGMPAVIANFRPRELWLPQGIPEEEIQKLLEVAAQYGVSIRYRKAGDSFAYGGAEFRVLAPDPARPVRLAGKSKEHRNDESLVMKISFGKTSALLEADAEKGTEKLISTENPEADLLKVAHHGSATSSNDDLLTAVKPRFAVISVGARNVYHHPRAEVLERLQQAKAQTFRTDMDGATSFYLDGKTVTSPLLDLQ
jgi:competence protein ComEC